jgi:hypothetical protein
MMTRQLSLFSDPAEPDFEVWWSAYPRKVGKFEARKAYLKVLHARLVTPDALLLAIVCYAKSVEHTEKCFVLHASTYLNQRRWEDEIDDEPSPRPSDRSGADRQDRIRSYAQVAARLASQRQ